MPTFTMSKFVVTGVIVALVGGFLLIAQPFDRQGESVPGAATGDAGTFSPTGSLAQPRAAHTATLLPDGRVLVVGGSPDDESATSTAEVWDPDTDSFSLTGSLADGRAFHSATLLPDGRVFVVGGEDVLYHGLVEDNVTSAEVWDPSTGAFSPVGSPELIWVASATLLADGRVLVVGLAEDNITSAEVWDPVTDTFSPAGLDAGHDYNAATALADGRVLIFKDEDPTEDGYITSAVVWDPVTDTVSPAGSPVLIELKVFARSAGTTTLLADGRVLIIAWPATHCEPSGCNLLAEVWDPATSTFSPAGLFPGANRDRFTATALADGRVLIAGGCIDWDGCGATFDSAEVWDPDTETFDPTGSLAVTRFTHTATALPDGRVLVVGGWSGDADADHEETLDSAEVWEPGER